MAQDYSISKFTRRCAISGRGLEPGESYVSVVRPRGDDLIRLDIAASEWKGAEPDTIGWWQSKMPAATVKKLRPAPNGILLDTLSELLECPGKEPLAYLLALLLVRRRVLTEETQLELDTTDDRASHWQLVCPADGRQWNVAVSVPQGNAREALQAELNALLFTED